MSSEKIKSSEKISDEYSLRAHKALTRYPAVKQQLAIARLSNNQECMCELVWARRSVFVEAIEEILSYLSIEQRSLIRGLYVQGMKMQIYAREYHMDRSTVWRRRNKILNQLDPLIAAIPYVDDVIAEAAPYRKTR